MIEVESLFPKTIERFPWAGHLGTAMTDAVVEQIEKIAQRVAIQLHGRVLAVQTLQPDAA